MRSKILGEGRCTDAILGFCLLAAVGIAVPTVFGQDGKLSNRIVEISIKRGELTGPLQYLASAYKVPIAFEPIVATKTRFVKHSREEVILRDRSVKEVLDFLVSWNPGYRWRVDNGVVEFFPANASDSFFFLNVRVSTFDAYELTVDEILRKLVKERSVVHSLNDQGFEVKELMFMPGGQSLDAKVSVQFTNTTVRHILNSLLLKSERRYWSISQWGNNEKYLSIVVN